MGLTAISRRAALAGAAAFATLPVWASEGGGSRAISPASANAIAAMPPYRPQGRAAGTVTLWGHGSFKHDFMGRLIGRWIAEFGQYQPAVQFDYRMYGTASAIGALYTGAGNLALLGEEISPAAKRAFTREKGYPPTGYAISSGSVDVNFFDYAHMVFVHRDNPLRSLSLPQLAAIFGHEPPPGRVPIRHWRDLGIDGPIGAARIQTYSFETDEDFGLFFRERVLADSHRWVPTVREFAHVKRADGTQYDHGQRILDALGDDRAGIAISNVRYATPKVRALKLSWRDGEKPVAASDETLISQAYPLVRIIPAYVDRAPGQPLDPALREFLAFILSRGGQTALVEESGYLPLGAEIARRERERLA